MANLNKPGSGKELLKQVKPHPAVRTIDQKAAKQLAEFKAKQQSSKNNA